MSVIKSILPTFCLISLLVGGAASEAASLYVGSEFRLRNLVRSGSSPAALHDELDARSIVQLVDEQGVPLLCHAVIGARRADSVGGLADYRAKIQLLIERGADVDASCNDGETPLFAAAASDRLAPAFDLLWYQADVNATSRRGDKAIDKLILSGPGLDPVQDRLELAELMLAHGLTLERDWSRDGSRLPTLIAAAQHWPTLVGRLIAEANANVDVRDRMGRTALHHAAALSQAEHPAMRAAIDQLIAAGAPVSALDKEGLSPLATASADGTAALLDAGVRADVPRGLPALHAAAYAADVEKVRLLLAAGADPMRASNPRSPRYDLQPGSDFNVGILDYLYRRTGRSIDLSSLDDSRTTGTPEWVDDAAREAIVRQLADVDGLRTRDRMLLAVGVDPVVRDELRRTWHRWVPLIATVGWPFVLPICVVVTSVCWNRARPSRSRRILVLVSVLSCALMILPWWLVLSFVGSAGWAAGAGWIALSPYLLIAYPVLFGVTWIVAAPVAAWRNRGRSDVRAPHRLPREGP